jgi:hypothetical protein
MNSPNVIVKSQQVLELNEDVIAAVVENLQLGRMDDCIKHYATLQYLFIQIDNLIISNSFNIFMITGQI